MKVIKLGLDSSIRVSGGFCGFRGLGIWVVLKIMIPFWVPYYIRDPKRDHNFENHAFGPREPNTL